MFVSKHLDFVSGCCQYKVTYYKFNHMSRQFGNFRDSRLHPPSLKDFTNSVDIKKFSRERGGNITPMNGKKHSFSKKMSGSNERIVNTHAKSLAITFGSHVSQKNMQTKRKLSSVQVTKSNHHSVSIDQHLLQEKYQAIKELFEGQKYEKVTIMGKNLLPQLQYSSAHKNVYYWLAVSLIKLHKNEEAVEYITECLTQYPTFQEGHLCLAHLNLKLQNYHIAVDHFEQAIRINNKNHLPYLQLALCYQKMRQNQKAIKLVKGVIDRFPKENEFLMVLVECSIELNATELCEKQVIKMEENVSRTDSLFLYIRGLLQKQKGNDIEAYILFEQSLKYNNNRLGVSKSLAQTVKIEIAKRDFYKAHHSISRIKFLELQETEEMRIYSVLIEGVMTMMKKKSQEAIDILNTIVSNRKCEQMHILSLLYKYLGYGYFKISQYVKSIKYYQKVAQNEIDQSSQYNKLLAEGIELADRQHSFVQAIAKFNQAKTVYTQKVQPYIYIAMTHILRYNLKKDKDDVKRAEVLIEALKQMQTGNQFNPNSSNLLYHRTIIHLFFEDWQQAHSDINRCIEKAEQNLPKYFYLRGVCYSCVKDFKKAINEYSICLSLDAAYAEAYLEKAKCYFLLGSTEKGFNSLKSFMEMNPDDVSIYKWIGDLLYEGMSYKDALKAYNQLGEVDNLQPHIMRLKCMLRVGTLHQISSQLKLIEKHSNVDKDKIGLDLNAFSLVTALLKHENGKIINTAIKKINKYLEQNVVGYSFQLIDCMNLLGIASFYLEKYSDAYESFLLVLELYQSLCEKETASLRSESCDEELDLRSEDIYFNIIICEFAQGNAGQAVRMIKEEYGSVISQPKKVKAIQKLVRHMEEGREEAIEWDFKSDKPINNKLKRVELNQGKIRLKTKPAFNLYHDSAANLYASSVADKMVTQLHAGYIDNMPEGPWIKRNPYGVIFTEDVIPSDNSVSFQNTPRQTQSRIDMSMDASQEQQGEKKTISKKEQFLKKLKFDSAVQAKLNNMIQRSQAEGMKKKPI